MRQINVSTARAELPSLVGSGERIVITRNGQPAAVLLGIDDYRVLRATQDLAGDPEAIARVHRIHGQLQRGDDTGLVELDFSDASQPAKERYPLPGVPRPTAAELREAPAPEPTMPQEIDSKFRFLLLAAKRAEQLMRGAQPKLAEKTSPAGPPGAASSAEESLELLSAAMANIATVLQALKEEAVAEARSAAAEEARHAVAEAISR
jgi:prevent-host-death family protein